MTPTHTTRGGSRRYRYYVCSSAQHRGRGTCPSKSVPAEPLEQFVIDRIRCIGRDPDLQAQVIAVATRQDESRIAELKTEEKDLVRDSAGTHAERKRLSGQFRRDGDNTAIVGRLADLNERAISTEARLDEVRRERQRIADCGLDPEEAVRTLAGFDAVWGTLTPRERATLIELLVEKVEYDGAASRIEVAFRPTGIRTLAAELEQRSEVV